MCIPGKLMSSDRPRGIAFLRSSAGAARSGLCQLLMMHWDPYIVMWKLCSRSIPRMMSVPSS